MRQLQILVLTPSSCAPTKILVRRLDKLDRRFDMRSVSECLLVFLSEFPSLACAVLFSPGRVL